MARAPTPLFETYDNFIEQDFSLQGSSLACVASFLGECQAALEPERGYAAVRAFLRAFSDNAQTFNSYRSHTERLLLWALLVQGKPLNQLKRQDAQDYLDFCRNPPADWVGPVTRSRFLNNPEAMDARDGWMPNPKWHPFNIKSRKATATESPSAQHYQAANSTLNQVFTVCSRFYEFLIEDGFAQTNPFRLLKKGNRFATQELESDLAGRKNWKPTMGDFRLDDEGNWWYFTVGKGNKAAKIAVRDIYVERYLKRYRRFLGLSELPHPGESTPLIKTLKGRAGLSDRQIRALLQAVFDKAVEKMRSESRANHEMESLRCASAHWLRHTSATFDAPLRNPKDLQEDLRHSNLSTTQNTYYHAHDQERAHSVKRIGMRDRG